jgi:hypothetical protein
MTRDIYVNKQVQLSNNYNDIPLFLLLFLPPSQNDI